MYSWFCHTTFRDFLILDSFTAIFIYCSSFHIQQSLFLTLQYIFTLMGWQAVEFWFLYKMVACHFHFFSIWCRQIKIQTDLRKLHEKWSFPSKISSANVTKFADTCGFGQFYWRNPKWKFHFLYNGIWKLTQPFSLLYFSVSEFVKKVFTGILWKSFWIAKCCLIESN